MLYWEGQNYTAFSDIREKCHLNLCSFRNKEKIISHFGFIFLTKALLYGEVKNYTAFSDVCEKDFLNLNSF